MEQGLPEFYSLEDALIRLDAQFSAAELHGAACGVLAVNRHYSFDHWVKQVAREALEDPETYDWVEQVFADAQYHLNAESLTFNLLLPEDEEPLAQRVTALQQWCQGFAYGLALSGLKTMKDLPADSREWVEDVVKIGSSGEIDVEDEEASEDAFIELVEFVRVGVLMMNEELQPVRGRAKVDDNEE